MSKKSFLSLSSCPKVSIYEDSPALIDPLEQKFNNFRDNVLQLKEEVNRLSFMMAEIQEVLQSSATRGKAGSFSA